MWGHGLLVLVRWHPGIASRLRCMGLRHTILKHHIGPNELPSDPLTFATVRIIAC
jgi:hypothetical protein